MTNTATTLAATEHGDITHACGAEFTCSIPYEAYEPGNGGGAGGYIFDGVIEGDATEDGHDVVCVCGAVIPEAAIVDAVEAARVEASRW